MTRDRAISLFCWLVLAGLLAGIWRYTALGASTAPVVERCRSQGCEDPAGVPLRRAPRSPAHRLVEVVLEGRSVPFLLDTGASQTFVSQTAAAELGLALRSRPILGAVNGSFRWQRLVRIAALAVGPFVYRDFDAGLVDTSSIDRALGIPIAGVLGANLLGATPFELDLRSDRFHPGCTAASFRAAAPAGARDSEIPLRELSGGWFVEGVLGDHRAEFLIDSGAWPSEVDGADGWEALALARRERKATRTVVAGSEIATVRTLLLPSLRVGDVVRGPFEVDVGRNHILGADFLDGISLHVDPDRARITLRQFEGGAERGG